MNLLDPRNNHWLRVPNEAETWHSAFVPMNLIHRVEVFWKVPRFGFRPDTVALVFVAYKDEPIQFNENEWKDAKEQLAQIGFRW